MADDNFEELKDPGPVSLKELENQDDLEFWIVRVSPEVAAAELQGCKLPLTQGRTTQSGGLVMSAETFVPPGLHVLLPNKKGRKLKPASLPLMGQIRVRRRPDSGPDDVTDGPVTSPVGPPEPPPSRPDRHPLLGVGYEAELQKRKRALEVSQTSNASTEAPVTPRAKKKRKSRNL